MKAKVASKHKSGRRTLAMCKFREGGCGNESLALHDAYGKHKSHTQHKRTHAHTHTPVCVPIRRAVFQNASISTHGSKQVQAVIHPAMLAAQMQQAVVHVPSHFRRHTIKGVSVVLVLAN